MEFTRESELYLRKKGLRLILRFQGDPRLFGSDLLGCGVELSQLRLSEIIIITRGVENYDNATELLYTFVEHAGLRKVLRH